MLQKPNLYPVLDFEPDVPAPLYKCNAAMYGASPHKFQYLLIPSRMIKASEMQPEGFAYISQVDDDEVFISAKPIAQSQRRRISSHLGRISDLQIPRSRLPADLTVNPVILAGPGYLKIVSASKAKAIAGITELFVAKGVLKDKSIPRKQGSLPAKAGIAWRTVSTAAYGRSARNVDVSGIIWEIAGFPLHSPIRVTCFDDAVLIERSSAEQSNSQLRSKLSRGKRVYGCKRFGRSVLEHLEGKSLHVIALEGALVLIDHRRSVTEFGLSEDSQDMPSIAASH